MQSKLQRQYEGYSRTPLLWKGQLDNIVQFEHKFENRQFNMALRQHVRLGHLVEQFVRFDLESDEEIELIVHNLQVHNEVRTLGEFDFIIRDRSGIKIIESAYKFYLFDPLLDRNDIAPWIGPNRKDSLQNKLHKIKNQQFKLIETKEAQELLEKWIPEELVTSEAFFKAQLFLPYIMLKFPESKVNPQALCGYYMRLEQLLEFKDDKFILLKNKHDWLIEPHSNVNWSSFNDIVDSIETELQKENSPMIWVKRKNGELFKTFVVWW